jgi:hypothetical protein
LGYFFCFYIWPYEADFYCVHFRTEIRPPHVLEHGHQQGRWNTPHPIRRSAMKKTIEKAPKNKIVPVEAPIVLTPDQIALIAAGRAPSAGGNTATSGVRPRT